MNLAKYSIGMGDRFAHQAQAQLKACLLAQEHGVTITPVWNKSNREHTIIGSTPTESRAAADAAVAALDWTGPYLLDADHINLETFPRFLASCDFFTIDVADNIGKKSNEEEISSFVQRHPELIGTVTIPHIPQPFSTDRNFVEQTARQFLSAVQHAATIYRAIAAAKGNEDFVAEISMDETDRPQTPVELLIILAAIGDERVPFQTIAPRFTGRFNKGVDYVGDVQQFAKEFRDDIATIAYAVERYGLHPGLKLSVHSGSDKYSIYAAIRAGMREFNAGVHVKTAGTTWLEEVIGLSTAGGEGLALAKEIYAEAYAHLDELCAPYASVIDIDPSNLPLPEQVNEWTAKDFVSALQHRCAEEGGDDAAYNPDLRQLLHVGFKIAAKMGSRYTQALEANQAVIAAGVTYNLFERHIRPIFLG